MTTAPVSTVIRAATAADITALWAWMQEELDAHTDDWTRDGSEAEFSAEMLSRLELERLWISEADGVPVGAIGYRQLTPDTGMLHGVVFTRRVYGTGVARQALDLVLELLRNGGVRKVGAAYLADNLRVRRFLKKAGFVDEGCLRAQVIRHGRSGDLRLVAYFAPAIMESEG